MPKTKTPPGQLARKERVLAKVDMPGIPGGTAGKVTFVEGFSWIRYWVRFENGVQRGSIDRKKLATPREWAEILRRRELGLSDDETEAASGAGNGTAAGAAPEAAAEGVVVNGVTVPALLIERTKKRREALGLS